MPAHRRTQRRGSIAPLAALLMPILMTMSVFMVDTGYITVTMTELQTAADSAALAGASQLIVPSGFGTYNQDTAAANAVFAAKAEAKKYCAYNQAGNVTLQLQDFDIVVGYQTTSGAEIVPWSPGQPFPNAVQVQVRRDSAVNGPLNLFIGPVIGIPTWSGNAKATARYAESRYEVTGFNQAGNANSLLLPIGVDVNYVNTLMATGKSADGIVYDNFTATSLNANLPAPLNVSNGPDNIPELAGVYPDSTSPGNFGLLNLNFTHPVNNEPQFSKWILYGPTSSDLGSFGVNGFQASPSSPTVVKGGPGWKSALQTDLKSIVGQSRILPLFTTYSGQGSNTYYTVVGFLAVTVVKAEGRGSNETIIFQPMIAVDPTATSVDSGTVGKTRFVYTTSPLSLSR